MATKHLLYGQIVREHIILVGVVLITINKAQSMAKNRLAKLLLEDQVADAGGTHEVTKFGVEQITNVSEFVEKELKRWDTSIELYDPLVEIAKLARMSSDENMQFKCHSFLAQYKYPQIRSLEIQNKVDKEVKITVTLAGYARANEVIIPPEDISTEGDIDEETPDDMTDYMLRSKEDKL